MDKHTPTIRVIQILEFLGSHGPSTLDTIMNHTKISYASSYRIIHTLLHMNYLEMDKKKQFKVSLNLINTISSSVINHTPLTQIAHASIQKLYYQTNETVHLAVLSGTKSFYLDKIESSHLLRMCSYIGYQADLHCTGIGKALLAWLDEKVLDILIPSLEFKKYTDNTITNQKKFCNHLKEIKQRGYSIDDEEHEKYLYCIAAPIFDSRNHPTAAVSISQPIIRFNKEDKEPFLKYLWDCARDISKLLHCTSYDDCLKEQK